MTAVKSSATDAVAGGFRDRKTMKSVNVLKEIEPDLESNASSSEDTETYSPKSVVVNKWPVTMKEVNVSRVRFNNPILRIRSEDRQIGEDIGQGLISKFVSGNDRVDVTLLSRPISPLSGKTSSIVRNSAMN